LGADLLDDLPPDRHAGGSLNPDVTGVGHK
jgi:hypothetical protein